MNRDELLRAIQSRAARIAIGASTLRGRGNTGAVASARKFLRGIDLTVFSLADEAAFQHILDQTTEELRSQLPRQAQRWGIARKALNIFLRDCLYTSYLAEAYRLRRAEHLFELPLDSITAKHLRHVESSRPLAPWPGVRHLSPSLSADFQFVAAEEARRMGIARVHLDAVWWSVGRDEDE